MTLTEHLNAAYSYEGKLADAPAVDPVAACAAARFDRTMLEAKRDSLAAIEMRCAVSRSHRAFLDRVLAAMP
jgi:hypothetical protein